MWELSLARFVIGLFFLIIASVMDLKTRIVTDKVWIILAAVGLFVLLFELYMLEVGWQYYLILIPILFLLVEAFVERPPLYDEGKRNILVFVWFLIPIFILLFMFYTIEIDLLFWSLISILVMMCLAFIFYYFAILYGGADAKAVLTLAILIPRYPYLPGITNYGVSAGMISLMEILFPFTLVILLNASLILLVLPIIYTIMNLSKGDISFPAMIFGYKKSLDEISDYFVWPMEYLEQGEIKIRLMPRGIEEDQLGKLSNIGRKRIWVTPKIPFLVPLCIGFVLSFVIGNPLMHLF